MRAAHFMLHCNMFGIPLLGCRNCSRCGPNSKLLPAVLFVDQHLAPYSDNKMLLQQTGTQRFGGTIAYVGWK